MATPTRVVAFADNSSFLRHKRDFHGYVPADRKPRGKRPNNITIPSDSTGTHPMLQTAPPTGQPPATPSAMPLHDSHFAAAPPMVAAHRNWMSNPYPAPLPYPIIPNNVMFPATNYSAQPSESSYSSSDGQSSPSLDYAHAAPRAWAGANSGMGVYEHQTTQTTTSVRTSYQPPSLYYPHEFRPVMLSNGEPVPSHPNTSGPGYAHRSPFIDPQDRRQFLLRPAVFTDAEQFSSQTPGPSQPYFQARSSGVGSNGSFNYHDAHAYRAKPYQPRGTYQERSMSRRDQDTAHAYYEHDGDSDDEFIGEGPSSNFSRVSHMRTSSS